MRRAFFSMGGRGDAFSLASIACCYSWQTGSLKDLFCQFFPFLFNDRISLRNPWGLVFQETKVFGTNGRGSSHNMALCSPILALSQYKRVKEMSYECLDTRKCCHAKL